MKIGLFYGSTTCYTEMAAEKIQLKLNELFGFELVDLYNIKDNGFDHITEYDLLILGISTWDFGELQEDWEAKWQDIETLELNNKTVALFGLGDQDGYAEWFQDALGMLHDVVVAQGASPIGYWPNSDEYDFIASKALTEDQSHFVGLALDDEGQYDKSELRISQWCEQLLTELA
ncbi:flavodoxin FldB [Psychrosphaera sp. B3R10]|uniref:flavodoxin FldB n=1 Tax=unclassified Psychrosphaera TaxID=2641570 RepID=UPI001C09BE04|nr:MULTISPECIES: flavodoxin FldB [unclassified Psychrosphaera]MBU2881436.1 flavodoxin FldB [Psychrosphaera sp. I2R16]MBU2989552.1 flavodoxin FldB [Psychrosphaera sp. B3R10]MDO6719269.1 flavodoxin FldB [Psychrosphaera sp. 1_MG-2023]